MKVLVISGFLGAGKTTFIKELIKRTKRQIVVLENEYGEVNLDAKEIRTGSDMKVYEFSDGCVCCTMKDGFVSSLMTISSTLDPEILIVEPTGIGKLGNIIKTVKDYEYERIKLLSPITVVSPDSFAQYRAEYPDIYLDQIENAAQIVFSKCEQASAQLLSEMAQQINKIAPDAAILPQHYSRNAQAWWEDLLLSESDREAAESAPTLPVQKPAELTLSNTRLSHPGLLVLLLESILRGEYGGIIRAKGVVDCGAFSLRFDVADNRYSIIEADQTDTAQSVFIGKNIDQQKLRRYFNIKSAVSLFGQMSRRKPARQGFGS